MQPTQVELAQREVPDKLRELLAFLPTHLILSYTNKLYLVEVLIRGIYFAVPSDSTYPDSTV